MIFRSWHLEVTPGADSWCSLLSQTQGNPFFVIQNIKIRRVSDTRNWKKIQCLCWGLGMWLFLLFLLKFTPFSNILWIFNTFSIKICIKIHFLLKNHTIFKYFIDFQHIFNKNMYQNIFFDIFFTISSNIL